MKDSHLKCTGCESVYSFDLNRPIYGCDNRKKDAANHILEKFLPATLSFNISKILDITQNRDPYILFKKYFFSYYLAEKLNVNYELIVNSINSELRKFGEPGFNFTPLIVKDDIKGIPGKTLIKNETVNVSGSHKARHLMGNIIYIEVLRKAGIINEKPKLAIYSCGNAALGAAAVAKAAGYILSVFIPPNVNTNVIEKLKFYGAIIVECPRISGQTGDPCYNRFQEALESGAVPFSCSGPDNWSNIEGGQTLGLELFAQAALAKQKINSVVIQVGGGALASSAVKSIEELNSTNTPSCFPSIHTVQTEGGFPLFRAFLLVLKMIAKTNHLKCSLHISNTPEYEENNKSYLNYFDMYLGEILSISAFAKLNYSSDKIQNVLKECTKNMNKFMWPWEGEPHSIAHGILDDVTYDWFKIIQGMLKSGGIATTVTEQELINANIIAKSISGIKVDPTGSSGFAGYIKLKKLNIISKDSSTAIIFTGVER
ncbi:MAG TPA: hypothetical protein DD381_04060 [Lentisphaeria bacterium]|nr:MAG: hypothetical protein A2X47_06570 [Lentisphaerae bacterium GWF2_38_69]HBM15505.1 hypothetical protein [Lentisphaeria bacterium]